MKSAGDLGPPAPRALLSILLVVSMALILAGVLLHTSGLDRAWILRVHQQAPASSSVLAWSCITVLGLGSSALILLLAATRADGRIAALLLPTFILGGALTHAPKWLLAVRRPGGSDIAAQLHVIGQTYTGPVSMPSGHALTAAAAALLLCIAVGARRPLALALIVLAAATVAWSRVVVGAHWPSDVFVGFGLGLVTVMLVLLVTSFPRTQRAYDVLVRRIQTKNGQFVVAAVEVVAAGVLLTEGTGYPAAQPMVVMLVAIAVGSALLRCRFALASAGRAPVDPT